MMGAQLSQKRVVSFLVVEDDEDHAELVIRSLKDLRMDHQITHIKDGAEARAYLFREGYYQHQKRADPDVILLDLKLPKIDGHEILQLIKSHPALQNIPVVILTTSNAEGDRLKAYQFHANSYLVKPLDFNKFRQMIDDLKSYWGVWNQPQH